MKVQTIGVAAAAAMVANAAFAQELSYRLPRTTLVAAWQARITHCPTPDDPEVRYATDASIAGAPRAGDIVRLNPDSPFLASRKIALTFHDDGTLKTFNAEGQGQDGTILASIVKTAVGFAALGVPVPQLVPTAPTAVPTPTPTPPPAAPLVVCRAKVERALERWTEVTGVIDGIEADAAAGVQISTLRASLLGDLKTEQADLQEELTLTTGVRLDRTRSRAMAAPAGYVEDVSFEPIDLKEWLQAAPGSSVPEPKVGRSGFCARLVAARADLEASTPIETAEVRRWRSKHLPDGIVPRERLDRLIYLMPVPVSVELRERTAQGGDCSIDGIRGRKVAAATVAVAQFSDFFILPIGSGAFNSKSTSAEFAAGGRILNIGTAGTGGGTQFSEALAGALAGAEAAQGAGTAAIQRRIDRIKAENELRDLLDKTVEK